MLDRDSKSLYKHQDIKILLVFFLYALAVGLFVQLILLPYIFPQWHAGNGLLIGIDSSRFHRIAATQASRVLNDGWVAWELRPEHQIVPGIASIFYVILQPKPWAMLPLNAVLHTLSAYLLWNIVIQISGNRSASFLATLPFLVFPSTLTWVAQMHNDSYSILGVLLVLFGFVQIGSRWDQNRED